MGRDNLDCRIRAKAIEEEETRIDGSSSSSHTHAA
jgi:hypothetical protein